MPGPYREFDSEIDRARGRGPGGNDILADAAPLLAKPAQSLLRKTGHDVSQHAFDLLGATISVTLA